MSKDKEQIEHIAELACIALDEQIDDLAQDFANIIKLADQLKALDTSNVEPMSHPLAATQRMRSDIASAPHVRDQALKLAPACEAGLYLVPQVIQ